VSRAHPSVVEPLNFEYKDIPIEYKFDQYHSLSIGDEVHDLNRKIIVTVVDVKLIAIDDRISKKIFLAIRGMYDEPAPSHEVRPADGTGSGVDEHVLYVSE
jgi:hypothetical protein